MGDCKVTFKNVPEDIDILPVINNYPKKFDDTRIQVLP